MGSGGDIAYYKKYADGRLEMWSTIADLYQPINIATGSIYQTQTCTIPFPIQSLTPCQVDFSLSSQGPIWGTLFTDTAGFKSKLQYRVYSAQAYSSAAYWYVHYHAWGTWK